MARKIYLDEIYPNDVYGSTAALKTANDVYGYGYMRGDNVSTSQVAIQENKRPITQRSKSKPKKRTRWVPKTKDQALRSLGETKKYTIQANDTLSKIDRKRWRDIAIANGISDPNKIQVGQTIDIPKDADGVSVKETTSAKAESIPSREVSTTAANTDSTATPKSTVPTTTSPTPSKTPEETSEETSEKTSTITSEETNRSLLTKANDRISKFKQDYLNDVGPTVSLIANLLSEESTPPTPKSTSANQDYGAAKIGLFTTPNEAPQASKPTSATEAIPISNPITTLASYVHQFTPRGQQELANTRLNEVRAEKEKALSKAKTLDEQLAISRQYNPTILSLSRTADPHNPVLNGEPGLGLVFPELALVNPAVKTAHKLFNIAYDRGEQALFDYRLGKPNVQSSADDVLDLYNGPSQAPIGNRSWYEPQPSPAQPRQVQVGYYNNPVTITRPGTYSSPQTQVGIPNYRRGIDFSRVGGRPRTYISPGVGPRRLATARPKQTYVEPEVNAMSWDGGGFYNIRGVGEPRVNFRYPDNVVMLNEDALSARPATVPKPETTAAQKPATPEPNSNSKPTPKRRGRPKGSKNKPKDKQLKIQFSLGGAIPLW